MSVCLSVHLSVPGQRAQQQQHVGQQQSRAAAGDVHHWLHVICGLLKFWSDCKEIQHTCLLLPSVL